MNYWTMLKYALMLLFFLVLVVGFALTVDAPEDQQPVPQTSQSKFNI